MVTLHGATSVSAIAIKHIRVERDRVLFDIEIAPSAPRYTDATIAAQATRKRPNLFEHTCVNARSRADECEPVFGSIIEDTSVPHLVEHVAIDVLVESALHKTGEDSVPPGCGSMQSNRTFVGTSEWLDEDAGIARVALSYDDDLEVLAAFKEAVQIVNECIATGLESQRCYDAHLRLQ